MRATAQYAALAALLAAATPAWVRGADDPADELKAAVVLSFIRYTEWPSTIGDTVTVGVLGRPAFAQLLGRTLEGRSAGTRHVRVIEPRTPAEAANCQVLYLATGRPAEFRPFVTAASGSHVLTIGEADRFLEAGGAVNLMIVDGRMSFEVDLPAVGRMGLNISSKLLRFGQIRTGNGERTP